MFLTHSGKGVFAKRVLAYLLASALVIGGVAPAFADGQKDAHLIDAETSVGSAEGDSALDVVSDPADAALADAGSVMNSPDIISKTVSIDGPDASDESVDATDDDAADADAAEAEQDTELCTWTRDGYTWSTSRGGSAMSVTDALAFGIDVSEWQGNIDWARVKAAGVQYAIVRCGYGSAESGRMDTRFIENVRGCRENGIPMGIYLYAQASTPEEGAAEAQHALALMSAAGVTPADLIYPVYYDMESENQRQTDAAGRGAMAENFCTTIAGAGYMPGIYASRSWFNTLLTDARFDQWTKWVAAYPSVGEQNATSGYEGNHDMWQCMSRGVIDGIPGRVDINFDYHFGEAYYAAIYDYDYYLASNPDIAPLFANNRAAAFLHFMQNGMNEGRTSSAGFNLHGYFNANPDLRRAFGLDLRQYYLHYLETGQAEGRPMADSMVPQELARSFGILNLSGVYDPYVYLANNPDLQAVYTRGAQGKLYLDDAGLLRHFVTAGAVEGRIAH